MAALGLMPDGHLISCDFIEISLGTTKDVVVSEGETRAYLMDALLRNSLKILGSSDSSNVLVKTANPTATRAIIHH
jgi:hypothetical protein